VVSVAKAALEAFLRLLGETTRWFSGNARRTSPRFLLPTDRAAHRFAQVDSAGSASPRRSNTTPRSSGKNRRLTDGGKTTVLHHMKLEEIVAEAAKLSEEERASLASQLLHGLETPVYWVSDDEVGRRMREAGADPSVLIPFDELVAGLRHRGLDSIARPGGALSPSRRGPRVMSKQLLTCEQLVNKFLIFMLAID